MVRTVVVHRTLVLWSSLVVASCAGGEREDELEVGTALSALQVPTCITIERTAATPVADTFVGLGLGPRGGAPTMESAITRFPLLRFDLGAVPAEAQITSAVMTLSYRDLGKGTFAPSTATIHRVNGAWAEGSVTFANFGFPVTARPVAQLGVARSRGAFRPTSADLTALVRSWTTGVPNFGVMIAESWPQGTEYRSSEATTGRPRLEVCYTLPTVSPCDANPCQHGGTCAVNAQHEAVCTCPAGWTGATCAEDRDECAQAGVCFPGAGCTNTPGGYACGACPAGMEGDGVTCRDVDGCSPNPCFEPATCADVHAPDTGFTCGACPAGMAGDGLSCHACPTGYRGQGTECVDIDECAQAGVCFPGVGCTNTAGSYACGACPAGMEGDGVTCRDVDGCSPNPCFEPATCADVHAPDTGFTCGACPAGMAGDGLSCHACPTGYRGQGTECVDIDECAQAGVCFPGVGCTNTAGGYACGACPAGMEGDGVTCRYITCMSNPCAVDVECIDTGTGYTCGPCPEGSVGDGVTCRYDGPWSEGLGASTGTVVVTDVAVTPLEKDVVATGYFNGTVKFGLTTYTAPSTGDGHMFVVSYDRYGRYRWSKHYDAMGGIRGAEIEAADGDIYVTATLIGSVDFGGDVLAPTDWFGRDAAIVHLDIDGNHVWSRRLGYAHAGTDSSLAVTATGLVYASFVDPDSGDRLARFDAATGEMIWQRPGFARLATGDDGSLYTLDATGRIEHLGAAGATLETASVPK